MSDDQPESSAPVLLRREALLPNERNRGLGTVAVVCTMAGVASGLALATTLMAMQVADSMSSRGCPYRGEMQLQMDVRPDHGYLGVNYTFEHGVSRVTRVLAGTPAEAIALQPGDHIVSVDNMRLRAEGDLHDRIFGSHPGAHPQLVIEREHEMITLHPTLIARPADLVVADYGQ